MAEEKEKKYRRIGWISAGVVQLVMLLIFYFLIAWREPDPPIPSYGIELAFGIENTGSGTEPISAPEANETQVEEQTTQEEVVEEQPVEEPTEEAPADPTEAEPVETTEPEIAETPVSETPSPDVVEENAQPVPAEEVVTEEQPEEEQPAQETIEEKPVEETPEETLNPEATMPSASDSDPNLNKGEEGGEGVAGKEEGSLDGRALMGELGSSKGASLQMAGWVWDSKPEPKDNSSESGKIVYKIKVDQDGYITSIELVSSTVSPVVALYYEQSIRRLTFSKTNAYESAAESSGTITFIIRAK